MRYGRSISKAVLAKSNSLLLFTLCLVSIAFLVMAFLPQGGLGGDLEYWVRWIGWIKSLGVRNIYAVREVNYFPLYIYILALFGNFYKTTAELAAGIYHIKSLILLFDFGTVFAAGSFFYYKRISPFRSLVILLNPAFFYNSLLWGQIESLYIFFIVAAFIAAFTNRKYLSISLAVLAFYSKLQAIIFFPALAILLLPQFGKNKLNWLQGLASAVITNLIGLFPFLHSLPDMFSNAFHSVDLFPVVSAGAFNFWVMVLSGANMALSDQTKFLFLSYINWGLLLFCAAVVICLIPVITQFTKDKFKEGKRELVYVVMLANALISLAFFYFNTQTHERYLQPTIVLLGIALVFKYSKRLLALYLVISAAFVLNLEKVGRILNLPDYESIIFSSRLLSIIFGICLLWGVAELYRGQKVTLVRFFSPQNHKKYKQPEK